ncbi:MAG: C39 family peptidase, partial [Thermodesulfovibrio sp.]|nr:C39 family peptidase [Thermodesulfovibrio sp.]
MIWVIIFSVIILPLNFLKAEEYLINSVPFFPAPQYQCGPASLATVLNFIGIKIHPEEIAKEIYSETARGTSDFDMILYIKKLNLKPLIYKGSLEDLREKIKSNKPVIVMVDEGLWFYKKYHFMVVVGFTDDSLIVNSGQKRHEKINNSDFIKKWSKTNFWTLLVE